jgi:hypothetical protein
MKAAGRTRSLYAMLDALDRGDFETVEGSRHANPCFIG